MFGSTSNMGLLEFKCVTRCSWEKIVRGLIEYFIELGSYSVGDKESSKDFKQEVTGSFSSLSDYTTNWEVDSGTQAWKQQTHLEGCCRPHKK